MVTQNRIRLSLGFILCFGALVVLSACRPATLSETPVAEPAAPVVPFDPPAQLRRPVALAVVDSGSRLLVANSRAGSVSVIDTGKHELVSETVVGEGAAYLVAVPNTNVILIADDKANEMVVARRTESTIEVLQRLSLPSTPLQIVLSADGTRAFVACSWARQIAVVDITAVAKSHVISKIELPFSPRLQRLLPDQRHLLVLDAFGGQVGVVDIEKEQLIREQKWTAHNLRGVDFAADGSRLLIPHQALMSDFATTQNGVHWGAVMMNVVRTVSLDSLFAERPPAGASLAYLGDENDAAGDPTDIVVTDKDQRIVALAGTSEVVISDASGDESTRVTVGRRPTALALSPDQQSVYVANTFGDSISIVDLNSSTAIAEISLGPQPELSVADRGELLFYDAHLSSDRWFSCHSCHVDGHSNGLLNDNFGDGSAGAPKRVLSLLGVGETKPWAWNGKREELSDQVRSSILTTMRGPEPSDEQVELLTAYLRTLSPPPSLAEARGELNQTALAKGADVFLRNGCADCHPAPNYTTPEVYDVGLHDSLGNIEFNPPSLRGVSQRNGLFHDNRAKDLADALVEHSRGLDAPIDQAELETLVAYLESL